MKHNFFKIVAVLVFTILAVSTSFGQSSATDHQKVSATIIAPITITKNAEMNFGVVVPGATTGTVVLTTGGSRSATGGTKVLTVQTGTVTAATFDVTGEPAYTFAISLTNSSVTLTNTTGTGAETLLVDNFQSAAAAGTKGTLDGDGLQTLKFGATLNVGTKTTNVPGLYTNLSDFEVTVNYN